MNPDYCNCNDFEQATDYDDIRYYKSEDDRFNTVKKPGWYIRSWTYDGPIASLEPIRHCP